MSQILNNDYLKQLDVIKKASGSSRETIVREAFKNLLKAWGNRSAINWVLDHYKEKKPKDPTIREKFDTYRFADYKDKVIDLLARVTTVSVQTVKVVEAMKAASR